MRSQAAGVLVPWMGCGPSSLHVPPSHPEGTVTTTLQSPTGR